MSARAALLFAVLVLSVSPAQAQPTACWQSVPGAGELRFVAHYAGDPMQGQFTQFSVRVGCDPKGLPTTLRVNVSTASADMSDTEANAELREPDWFDVASHPEASFDSGEIQAADAGFLATGKLGIKGIALPLALPFTWQVHGDSAELAGSVRLSRASWRIGAGEWAKDAELDDAVDVSYRVTLVRAGVASAE